MRPAALVLLLSQLLISGCAETAQPGTAAAGVELLETF
jgi:hypothetical protein